MTTTLEQKLMQKEMLEADAALLNAFEEGYKGTFRTKMKRAAEEGLLIFTKYALVLILAYFALTFGTQLVNGSINGTQSALYLNELQNKGYLPKVVNGQVPMKESINETPNTVK